MHYIRIALFTLQCFSSYKYSKLDCLKNKYGKYSSYVTVFIKHECFIYVLIQTSHLNFFPHFEQHQKWTLTEIQPICNLFQSDSTTTWIFRWAESSQTTESISYHAASVLTFHLPFHHKTHFLCSFFLTLFLTKDTKHSLNWSRYGRWVSALVRVQGSCCVPLNGGHRSVKMCLQLLLAADRWPTGPWIVCLTFRAAYQPVFPIVVARCKRATCSPTAVINEDDFFPLFLVTQPKRGVLTFEAGAWIDSNQSSRLTEQNP